MASNQLYRWFLEQTDIKVVRYIHNELVVDPDVASRRAAGIF